MTSVSHQAMLAAMAAGLITWTFIGQTSASTTAITGPGGCQAGDLALYIDAPANISGGGLPAAVVPSGYTQLATSTLTTAGADAEYRNTISCKVLTGGDLTAGTMNSVSGMSGTVASRKIVAVFRPSAPITGVNIGGLLQEAIEEGNPAAQVIAASAASNAVIILAVFRFNSTVVIGDISAPGMTVTQGASATHFWAYAIDNASFADRTVDTTIIADSQTIQSFYLTAA